MTARTEAGVTTRPIPPVTDLKPGVGSGWNCVWCGGRLTKGAVSVGWARGRHGAHVLDCEVWACPGCGKDGRR